MWSDQIPQHRAGALQGSALFLSLYSHTPLWLTPIHSQGFFILKPKLIYFSILNSMEFYLFLTKTVDEDEARIKPSLLFFLYLIIVNS